MEKGIAERILAHGNEASGQLHDLLIVAQAVLPPGDFETVRRAVGHILVSIQTEVLKPVYVQYPELDKHGYFTSQSKGKRVSESDQD